MNSAKKTYDGKIAGLYDLEETLGRGHFAVVKLARHVFTGEKVAVKVIDKTKLDEVSRAHLFQEVRCMKLVQHPNVVRLYEVIDTQTKLYLILELGDGGDLYDYIMKHEAGLGEEMAKEYFRQIVRAISYCHQLHVVHRDLKPENVVFFERLGVVKLTDFGFSNKFCPGQKLETSCGSLAYSAPEILLGDSYDAPAVDVWSLGVILYMLVVGQAPFQEANDSETLTMIMDCKYTIPTHVSEDCKRLIARMLVREPESRATLADIASDPWLGGPPQIECLPLVSRHQVTEEDHNIIINKIVNGNIATKEEVLEALDRNEYNHITATYFLLAERKLRAHRPEQAQNRMKPNQILINLTSNQKNSTKANVKESKNSDSLQLPTPTSVLSVPRTPGDQPQGRVRKCSIVQEEEDEEEYCGVVGSGQELTPPHSSLNRRGSRSEGKLNIAIQERIAEERRKERKESPSNSPHSVSGVGRVVAKDDNTCWSGKRSSPTSLSSGIPAPYIPKWRMGANKKYPVHTSSVDSKTMQLDSKLVSDKLSERYTEPRKVLDESLEKTGLARTNECSKIVDLKLKGNDTTNSDKKVVNSSQVNKSPSKNISSKSLDSEISTISLTDSATITIPFHPTSLIDSTANVCPKFKTMPSPTRLSHSIVTSPQLNEIFEEGVSEFNVNDSKGGENRTSRIGITGINYEQKRSKFHKGRTASCSSSDASDDDSESRKKRAHKISTEKNNQRRDSHDDSSDSQDRGGSGGLGGNPPAGLSSEGDGMENQSQSGNNQQDRSSSGNNHAGNSNNRNQRQCNGENFRRNRRRTGETRLRESQSLNRITEVQESEAHSYAISNTEVFHERLRKSEIENYESNINNNNIVGSVEKSKTGRSLGARFLQSWSNTLSSTKLSVNKRKYLADASITRGITERSEQIEKHYSDEKENKALVEKSGKKVKLLGRYFQVSKKLCIPLPSLISKGRLYKARSCGSIAKDRITPPMNSGTSAYKPTVNGIVRNPDVKDNKDVSISGRFRSPDYLMNQSLDSIDLEGKVNKLSNSSKSHSMKSSPNKSIIKQAKANNKQEGNVTNQNRDAVLVIYDNGPSISDGYGFGNANGDINKNLSSATDVIGCPKDGICQMHMRDAAKCHLS